MEMSACDSVFVESTYSKASAPQPHEILVKSESVTYTTDSAAVLRVDSTDVNKVISCFTVHDRTTASIYTIAITELNFQPRIGEFSVSGSRRDWCSVVEATKLAMRALIFRPLC